MRLMQQEQYKFESLLSVVIQCSVSWQWKICLITMITVDVFVNIQFPIFEC